jgi:diguanylate cyclase (GGDEF)-like protein
MSRGRSKLYDTVLVAECGDVTAAPVASRRDTPLRNMQDARCEIDTLRAINGQLVRRIAELTQREAQTQHLADRDGLTGLYNRRKMSDILDGVLDTASQADQRVGLLFIDLDGFKGVNDAYGHPCGDKLLTKVAARIAARARAGDFVCRYGGDEFVVVLPNIGNVAAARQVAAAIAKRVALPYRIDGVELQLTAAIGVAVFPDQAAGGTQLLELADESMYRAKARHTDPVDVFEELPAPTRRHDDPQKRRSLS